MLYKFLLLLISFIIMIISCSESDVSTTELANTSTPLLASTPNYVSIYQLESAFT